MGADVLSSSEMIYLAPRPNDSVEITRRGSGPPLLFLHDGDGVEENDDLLSRLGRRFSVIAPSHPGFGGSSLPRSFRSVGDLAFHYLDLVEQLDLHDIVLVATSFGGWIAAEFAIRSTDRVSKLVLIDPLGAKFDGPDGEQIRDIFTLTHRDVRAVLRNDQQPDRRDMSADLYDNVARRVLNWSHFLRQPAKVGSSMRMTHHEDAETVFG